MYNVRLCAIKIHDSYPLVIVNCSKQKMVAYFGLRHLFYSVNLLFVFHFFVMYVCYVISIKRIHLMYVALKFPCISVRFKDYLS